MTRILASIWLMLVASVIAIANGCFFNLGARLARYTGNDTYARYAEETWDWLWAVQYIDHNNWLVYDGAHDVSNCTDVVKATYSYNAGVLLQGAAFMYDYVSFKASKLSVDNVVTRLSDISIPG